MKQNGCLSTGCYGSLIYSKSVRGLVQWSLRSLETLRPEVAPSLRSGRHSLRPSVSNRVETLDSASNYYLGHGHRQHLRILTTPTDRSQQ